MADDAGGKEVGRISIRVVPNLKKFWSDLKGAIEEAERTLEANIKVVPKMDGFREKLRAETAKLPDAQVKIKTEIDKSDFLTTLAEAKAAAKAAGVKLDVDFKDHEAEAKLAALIAKLKAEAHLAKIDIGVNTGGKVSGGLLSGIGDMAKSGFNILKDDTTAIIALVTALLAPALALLSSALVALPALISAVTIPLGVFALGLGGIKKALVDVGLMSDEKDKKGKDKFGVGQVLKDLQQQIGDVFEKGLVPIFQNVLSVLPRLTGALPRVAQGIVDVFGGFTKAFTSDAGVSSLRNLIDNVGGLLSGMAPGIQSFTSAILNLASGVSNHFPGLANWFNSLADKFSGWVSKIMTPDASGASTLDKAMTNLKPVLDGVFGFLGGLLKSGLDLAKDPGLADKTKTFITDLKDIVLNALPTLDHAFKDLTNTLTVLSGIIDLITGKSPKDQKDLPNGPGNQGGVKIGGNTVIPGLPSFSKQGLLNLITDMLPGPGQLASLVVGWFQGVDWSSVFSGITTFFSNFGTIAGTLWDGFTAKAQEVWGTITSAASTAWTAITTIAQTAWQTITSFFSSQISTLSGIWDGVASAAQGAWDSIVSAAQTCISNVVSFFQGLPGQIVSALGNLSGLLVAAGKAAMDGLLQGIKAGAEAVYNFVSGIANKIASLKGPLPYDRQVLIPNGQALMQGLQAGIEGGFEGVKSRASQLAQEIADAMSNGMAGVNMDGVKAKLKQEMAEINAESNQLRLQRDQTDDKGQKKAIGDQLKQLSTLRDQLKVQQDQLGITNNYTDSQNDITKQFQTQLGKLVGMGQNFAMSNVKQFESDIGISGNGAIPQVADQLLGWGSGLLSKMITGNGTTINVNSIDEGLAAKRNIENRKALQWDR